MVLVGPSAVGKSTVVRQVRTLLPDLFFSVSATTRAPRPGEVDGRDYLFVDDDTFSAMSAAGDFLEEFEVHGMARYGTPAGPVREALAAGVPVLVEVDLDGSRVIAERMPEAYRVFLAPPSWEELVRRLTGRGTESPEVIERRLTTARRELDARPEFDHILVNDEVDRSARELVSLLVGNDPSDQSTPDQEHA